MRHYSYLPPNYGSHRFEGCPPSHHKMALSPHLAQASAQAPQPYRPTPPSTVTSAQISPHHQRGSTMPSAAPVAHSSPHFAPFVSMGWKCPHARPYDCSYGSMVPSPATTGAAMPLPSLANPSLPAQSPPFPSTTKGGGYYLTARTAKPSVRVTPSSHPMAIIE
jgi:hypothetical protein